LIEKDKRKDFFTADPFSDRVDWFHASGGMTVNPSAFNGKTKRSPIWLLVAQVDQQNAGWCRPPDEWRNIAIKRRTSAHEPQNQASCSGIELPWVPAFFSGFAGTTDFPG
jgi:hypothetical protein